VLDCKHQIASYFEDLSHQARVADRLEEDLMHHASVLSRCNSVLHPLDYNVISQMQLTADSTTQSIAGLYNLSRTYRQFDYRVDSLVSNTQQTSTSTSTSGPSTSTQPSSTSTSTEYNKTESGGLKVRGAMYPLPSIVVRPCFGSSIALRPLRPILRDAIDLSLSLVEGFQ